MDKLQLAHDLIYNGANKASRLKILFSTATINPYSVDEYHSVTFTINPCAVDVCILFSTSNPLNGDIHNSTYTKPLVSESIKTGTLM